MISDWPGHGQIALHGQHNRHVDRAGHHHIVQAVQKLSEDVLVQQTGAQVATKTVS